MKMIHLTLLGIILIFIIVGCDSAIYDDKISTERQLSIYRRSNPLPVYDHSQDLEILSQIYTLKNEVRTTWSIISSEGTGEVQFTCPSLGYAIPADTQLTNPLQAVAGGAVIEQPEPNGLFSSKNTDGTYVMCVRENGDVVPVYTELKVTTFPFPVEVQDGRIVEVTSGSSTIKIDMTKVTNASTPQVPSVSPTP